MTCFWDGIIIGLEDQKLESEKLIPMKIVQKFKSLANIVPNVLWNNQMLREQELKENLERINNLDINSINNGYDCSCSDPFLFLLADIYKVDIKHNFNGYIMNYNYIGKDKKDKVLNFQSNRFHFWYVHK